MPKFKNDPEGVKIRKNGVTLATRGWLVDDMVLVDAVEFARELNMSVGLAINWDGGDGEFEDILTLETSTAPEDKSAATHAEEPVTMADLMLQTKEEIEEEYPHELHRPVKGPIRRLVTDPDSPKGCERSLRVPPGGTIDDAYPRE